MRLRDCLCTALALVMATGLARAQDHPPAGEDPLGPPTERGIRMTPGMARALARLYTRNVLVNRYEMDSDRTDEAVELVARRIMQFAHTVDADGSALMESMITRMSELGAQGAGPEEILSPDFQKEIARHMLPAIPALRDLIGGVVRDTLPMLAFKQQIRMTTEAAATGAMINGFEQNMQRWARGEGIPGEDPFSNQPPESRRADASGQSPALKTARQSAEKELDKQQWLANLWGNYLKEFKAFYALDDSQAATADSILRDYLERARALMQDAGWRDQIYRSRLWLTMGPSIRIAPVFNNILSSRYEESMAPINALGDEFRLRLEDLPTEAQRAAAMERVTAALKERGYDATEVQ